MVMTNTLHDWPDAACRRPDANPNWWDEPDPTVRANKKRKIENKRALMFCAICPVKEACLEDALDDGYDHQFHIRGGMTEHERRVLLKRLAERGKVA